MKNPTVDEAVILLREADDMLQRLHQDDQIRHRFGARLIEAVSAISECRGALAAFAMLTKEEEATR